MNENLTDYHTIAYLNDSGDLEVPHTIPDEVLLKGYRDMVVTRLVDERMVTLQRQGSITFALSSLGEEACAVASAAALKQQDWLYPQYRELGVMFWRGYTIEEYLHHMFGNAKDSILGRQMPNHFGSKTLNVVNVSSPIGTKIPHAAGCAYAMKLQKEDAVAVAYFGDGATSEGDFHCGVNFAAVRKAPAIFFCRNNGYAISTPIAEQFASAGIAPKGVGYGVETYRVDGNDFFAVYDVVKRARQHCADGKGPVLIEAMTYRLGAHSTSDDPARYRSEDEVARQMQKCPIRRLRLYLEKKNLWDEDKENTLIDSVKNEITQAITSAKAEKGPPLRSLIEDVYLAVPEQLEKEYEELKRFFPEAQP
ncbi:MAG: thiamine pyrophosphate-dependent dehydrogenase E1 component subunit alpha [Chlamydiales bacterium]|nr:thiamine pyrophosphate-dependent dehydrogenase E1 component subunit alpha [Chlamydiia bacterium]MCP5508672.1 thiamine pyrophosphate-dependent dehydrogenase E1 component subunit alpha [Chlamydiales bacterium]